MHMNGWDFLAVVIGYVLGSFPTAYYTGLAVKGVDLRTVGSGNLGFTNAWRTLGLWISLPVLAIDIAKGAAAVSIARTLAPGMDWTAIAAGLAAILGHNWTLFLGFRGGGKGVAASAGVFLALAPVSCTITLVVFTIVLFTTKYMSIASMTGAATMVTVMLALRMMEARYAPSTEVFLFACLAAAMLIYKHKTNIKRLMNGTETRIGRKKEEASS